MATYKDWAGDAAREIDEHPAYLTVEALRVIIAKHSPVEEGVLYMPVPRCDSCTRWTKSKASTIEGPVNEGRCSLHVARDAKMWTDLYDGIITEPDFGCVQWEAK